MKKKLSLEKFTIAKLDNPNVIMGGTGANDGTVDEVTRPLVCINQSDDFISQEEAEEGGHIPKKTIKD